MLRLLAWTVAFMVAVVVRATAAAPGSDQEYAVKAALVFNFMKFIDWPAHVTEAPGEPLVVGVLSASPIEEFERALREKAVKGRRITVHAYRHVHDVRACHVLFIAADGEPQLSAVLRAVSGKAVLTVSEVLNAEQADAVINFVAIDTKLGFQVNLDAAEAGGLRVSSRLLALAVAVRGGQSKGRTP